MRVPVDTHLLLLGSGELAAAMYREMDMRFWLERVEKELRGA